MKADIPLPERRRIEREQQAEIRAMLAPRHFAAMHEQMALDAIMHHLEMEQLRQAAPAIATIFTGISQVTVPMPAPVVIPKLASAAQPIPAPPAPPAAPDMPFDLRYHLGLQ
jgi:hypothetical protein